MYFILLDFGVNMAEKYESRMCRNKNIVLFISFIF